MPNSPRNAIVTENALDDYVRKTPRDAQGAIPELVYRLVAAAVPSPDYRRFPIDQAIGQTGPDGLLRCKRGFEPFVPDGPSYWEVGTGDDAARKASSDYKDLVDNVDEEERLRSTFVFITPLSATRGWKHSAQEKWIKRKKQKEQWKDVRVLDGTRLIDWIAHFPAVERWLAEQLGIRTTGLRTLDHRWSLTRETGKPPPLDPNVFLVDRDTACSLLESVRLRKTIELRLDTHYPEQIPDFVAAHCANLPSEESLDLSTRALIVQNPETWEAVSDLRDHHLLIANFPVEESDDLLQIARHGGHAIVYGGLPGGMPHPNRAPLSNPREHSLEQALVSCGFTAGRARLLATKTSGNLTVLKKCLHNLSLSPEWASSSEASELAIAQLIGSWDDANDNDRSTIETIAGKQYGEWIESIRQASLRPATPLALRNSRWRFAIRYQGWYHLGPRIFDDHLDRFQSAVVALLRTPDPKFELDPKDRFAASIHGKVPPHSHHLVRGLTETIALLGSHPDALTSCSTQRAVSAANQVVRSVLHGADWRVWASLNDHLPSLAEGSPTQFLEAVEHALLQSDSPFDDLFAQEEPGFSGATYMAGLLWALETIAWDPEFIVRVLVALAQLDARDPGGTWGNRPGNAMTTALLPWRPQTCASPSGRFTAVETVLRECPEQGWKLLLSLIPDRHATSSGTRKPTWRETIPPDWNDSVTTAEYWEQAEHYSNLAIDHSLGDSQRLVELIGRFDDLPPPKRSQFVLKLKSEAQSIPEPDRVAIWERLRSLTQRHRKYADADWTLEEQEVQQLESVANDLVPDTPVFRVRHLFTDQEFHLFEEAGNYQEQQRLLRAARHAALTEVLDDGGLPSVRDLCANAPSPFVVGRTLGEVSSPDADSTILPHDLLSPSQSTQQFATGFVVGRVDTQTTSWIDTQDSSGWTAEEVAAVLNLLPFSADSWTRVDALLEDPALYWRRVSVRPYGASGDLERAARELLTHDRPHEAIRCLATLEREQSEPPDEALLVDSLRAASEATEEPHAIDAHSIIQLLQHLQTRAGANVDQVCELEWRYLGLLDRDDATPRTLEQHLANDPKFFHQLIETTYRSDQDPPTKTEPSDGEKNAVRNAFKLLSNWRIPPGVGTDGSFNSAALSSWLQEAESLCRASGHLSVAQRQIGSVLTHAPPDPDGLWIHHTVASALNSPTDEVLRRGFTSQLYNSRGVYSWTAGREELEIASNYRQDAEAVESSGYHRLAAALRTLASSYEHQAELEADDPFDD